MRSAAGRWGARRLVAMLVAGLAVGGGCAGAPKKEEARIGEAVMEVRASGVPETRREEVSETIFGETVNDPWRWLEDGDSPEVRAWMDAQDEHARGAISAMHPERYAALKARLSELYYVDSISAPTRRGSRWFYTRRHADREKAVHYWKEGRDGEERVLLDPNAMSTEETNLSISRVSPSLDGRLVAFNVQENNADESVLRVMRVETGEVIDELQGAKYARAAWLPDGSGFYWVHLPMDPTVDVSERPGLAEIRFHRVGTPQSEDALVRGPTGDPTAFAGVDVSRDGEWLFAYTWYGWNATDILVRRRADADAPWTPLTTGRDAVTSVTAHGGWFFLLTNDGSPTYRVDRVRASSDGAAIDRSKWETIVPASDRDVIENLQIVGDRLVLTWTVDVTNRIRVYGLDGTFERELPMPGPGVSEGLAGDPDETGAWYRFESLDRPPVIFETDVATGETSTWAEIRVPVDTTPYVVEQKWFVSRDGTRVPMFLIHRRDLPMDGSTPTLLYGYGGFNVTLSPWFRASIFPWLEAGGAYVLANLRGGAEFGEAWHRAGMLDKKQNVFDDFLAAADFLIDEGYTSPSRLAIQGGSNGGLLVGAAMTQAPEKFRAVVCAVPLLDMVRYHKFGSGRTWTREYGDPDVEADFRTLFAYSPYHRVEPGTSYPAMLMQSADSDDRVDPMHARKFVAAIRDASTSPHPVLLRIERNAGHGGADMVRQAVESGADQYLFLMHELGMLE